jgi:hypothetical protein
LSNKASTASCIRFVAHDDVWRAQFDEPFQAIVAVDDAPVKVVEVRGRKAAAVERHSGCRSGGRTGTGKDHPLGLVARTDEGLDDLQPLASFFGFSSVVDRRSRP